MTTDNATAEKPEEQPDSPPDAQAGVQDAGGSVAVAERPASQELTMADLLDQYVPSKALRRGEIIDGKVMSKTGEGLLITFPSNTAVDIAEEDITRPDRPWLLP